MNKKLPESKDNIKEKEERKRTDRFIARYIGVAGVFCLVVISFFVGFAAGQKSQVSVVEAEIEAIKQEAAAKVEAAQQEANAKIETFEKKALQDCDEEKYQMLEECFENREKVRRGEEISFSYETLKMDGIPFPDFDFWDDSVDDAKILKYVEELKETAEKYHLSPDINYRVIYYLEKIEEDLKGNIQNVETFEVIWEIKEQCNKNRDIWY